MPDYFILLKNCGNSWNDQDKKLLSDQMKVGWDLGQNTVHRLQLKPGDKALIYISGNNARVFVGEATVGSIAVKPTKAQLMKLNTMPLVAYADFWFRFRDFQLWCKPMKMADVIEGLSFINNKKNYGSYLMGGVKRISPYDYAYLLECADKHICRSVD